MSAEVELARLERQVLGVARVSSFFAAVRALRVMLDRKDPGLRAAVLKLTAPAIGRDLAAAVAAAYVLGIRDAEAIVGSSGDVASTAPPALVAAAAVSQKAVAAEIAKARALAQTDIAPDVVLAPVLAAQNALRRDAVTLINSAGNMGATAVADAAGIPTVWIAETNACVECLAYSGRVAKPGKPFPGGLTYAAKSYNPNPVIAPPRHPHCRCTVEPLNDQSYADALRREADRSVLRGFSLASEPMSRRVAAAERLLADPGLVAPKSVIDYARRAVKSGKFPTRGR